MELPSLYKTADAASLAGQQLAKRLIVAELFALLVAAGAGSVNVVRGWRGGEVDLASGVALIALSVAVLCGVWRALGRPEKQWYLGRALAESVKSLSLLYCAGGYPFPSDSTTADTDFVGRLRELAEETQELDRPSDPVDARELTPSMRDLRAGDPADRRAFYLEERLDDQIGWYGRKADFHRTRAWFWSAVRWASILVGLIAASIAFLRIVEVNWLGVATTAASAVLAWSQLNQHDTLVSSYRVAGQDLRLARDAAPIAGDEDAWSRFVSDTETAISREHTMWLARREMNTRFQRR